MLLEEIEIEDASRDTNPEGIQHLAQTNTRI